ncbi:hypothetical protein LSAT2_031265 [Lamellibrachia satsuma]|nr:hypothetical protein LSAT2_031265 [Lamellibrachia satsuma]
MALIQEADVFIPEASEYCSPDEKIAYQSWIDNTLISELNFQHISYVHPHRHFPAAGDPPSEHQDCCDKLHVHHLLSVPSHHHQVLPDSVCRQER